jgi:hypothetical protein
MEKIIMEKQTICNLGEPGHFWVKDGDMSESLLSLSHDESIVDMYPLSLPSFPGRGPYHFYKIGYGFQLSQSEDPNMSEEVITVQYSAGQNGKCKVIIIKTAVDYEQTMLGKTSINTKSLIPWIENIINKYFDYGTMGKSENSQDEKIDRIADKLADKIINFLDSKLK